jgi:hypothetical protein
VLSVPAILHDGHTSAQHDPDRLFDPRNPGLTQGFPSSVDLPIIPFIPTHARLAPVLLRVLAKLSGCRNRAEEAVIRIPRKTCSVRAANPDYVAGAMMITFGRSDRPASTRALVPSESRFGAYQASASAFGVAAANTATAGAAFDLVVTALDPFDQVAVGYGRKGLWKR